MAEHLHGYPHCDTPAGQPCPPTDVNYAECQTRGALLSCAPSVVDGIPTGQYHCVHRDAPAAPARPAAKAKARPKKKAARKAKGKPKKAARKAAKKPAKKTKAKAGKKAGRKKKK